MTLESGTYDSEHSNNLALADLVELFASHGAIQIHVKPLAANDNSKNQIYLSSHLTDLSFIPTGELEGSTSSSNKPSSARKIKYQTSVPLSWLDPNGHIHPAPNAKLIYYPQYPEVRFSGFLSGSTVKINGWMDPSKKGREQGRWLVIGVCSDQKVLCYLATPGSRIAGELERSEFSDTQSSFKSLGTAGASTKEQLISALLHIHSLGWVPGQKLNSEGISSYNAMNGAGYTLEALLGVKANGFAEPDYLGWEVKQFGVRKFPATGASPTTLFTPEPNGGIYQTEGAPEFMRRFGYPDKKGIPDRINFGGIHRVARICGATGLALHLDGYDTNTREITNANGTLNLIDQNGTIAASWGFPKLMNHWKEKHSQAAYIPCVARKADTGGREYYYGTNIELGEGTSFQKLLSALTDTIVYYDPGIKLENASNPNSVAKKRSQFRVAHKNLSALYEKYELNDISQ